MSIVGESRAAHPISEPVAERPLDRDTVSFVASLLVHVGLLLALGFSTYFQEPPTRDALTILAPVEEALEEREVVPPEDFFMNDRPVAEVGANSSAKAEMALSAAEMLSDISDVPSPAEL
ncbi:MAG: hypothetical protein WD070_11305, partial [Pirellulaceae bacterium]